MNIETTLPDIGFDRQQKEYLQGYFAGLAFSGMVPFVGHLPDGRMTNVPAPGLVNRAADPETSAEKTVYSTPVSDLCEQELWKLEQHGLDVWDKLIEHANEDKFPDKPINIHLTGCPNSCAQHYMGDIGLLGATVKQGGDTVEGYHVLLGGGFGEKQAVAREVFRGVPFNELPTLLEHVLKIYLAKRKRGERFVEFTRRHSVKELQELFSE